MTNAAGARNSRVRLSVTTTALAILALLGLEVVANPSAKAQTLTTLHSFDGADGAIPNSALLQGSDGSFYGTTNHGGANSCFSNTAESGCGTIFRITAQGTLTTLYNFSAGEDGAAPYAGLVEGADGNFYGTASWTGASLGGTVFKITPAGALTTLYRFCAQGRTPCLDGNSPLAALVQGTDGNFYGTTSSGGANNQGTVFKITPSGELTTLYSFCSQGGTACSDGSVPHAALIQASDGNFYGTTYNGGDSGGGGTIFKITPSGALTTVYSFCYLGRGACPDGNLPETGLLQTTDGNFYGTASNGGYGYGTVFEVTPSGTLTTLYSFCSQGINTCPDGGSPYAGLVLGSDGNFYGAVETGGAGRNNGYGGTIFRITPTGLLTTLYSFCSEANCTDGSTPVAALVQGKDGNFYGTTSSGGANDDGTVFSLSQPLPGVSLSSASLAFGNQLVGTTSVPQALTITNSGSATLNISSLAITGTNAVDFGLTSNPLPISVAPGSATTVKVSFTPTTTGTLTATLTIADNGGYGGQQAVSLTGSGEGFTLSTNSNSASVTAGGTATFTLTVESEGGFNQMVNLSCSGAPDLSTCTISPSSITPTGTGLSTATVSITTTAPSRVNPRMPKPPTGFLPWTASRWLWLFLVGILALPRLARIRLSMPSVWRRYSEGNVRRLAGIFLLVLALSMIVAWAACGGGSGGGSSSTQQSSGTPAGAYTITLTATDTQANLSRTTTVTLSVSQ